MAQPTRHFLQIKDFSREELEYLFARTRWIKERFKRYERYWPLEDRTLVMIFEKAWEDGMVDLHLLPGPDIDAYAAGRSAPAVHA